MLLLQITGSSSSQMTISQNEGYIQYFPGMRLTGAEWMKRKGCPDSIRHWF